jgi:hypothetical protein
MPKYEINIEGTFYEWDTDKISVPELRALAGLAAGQEMIEIDLKDNSERTLSDDEVVDLKPGKGFAKKVSFKRG